MFFTVPVLAASAVSIFTVPAAYRGATLSRPGQSTVNHDEKSARKRDRRRELRAKRRAIDPDTASAAAAAALRHLLQQDRWRRAARVGVYLANDGEMSTDELTASARRAGKVLFLPSVRDGRMVMRRWSPERDLVRNRYGIAEPDPSSPAAEDLDVLLIPLVGWSASGCRLGMGGGYYDRMLASFPAGCWRVGVAYDCQRDDALDALREEWDEDLDAVLTESGLRSAARPRVSAGR